MASARVVVDSTDPAVVAKLAEVVQAEVADSASTSSSSIYERVESAMGVPIPKPRSAVIDVRDLMEFCVIMAICDKHEFAVMRGEKVSTEKGFIWKLELHRGVPPHHNQASVLTFFKLGGYHEWSFFDVPLDIKTIPTKKEPANSGCCVS